MWFMLLLSFWRKLYHPKVKKIFFYIFFYWIHSIFLSHVGLFWVYFWMWFELESNFIYVHPVSQLPQQNLLNNSLFFFCWILVPVYHISSVSEFSSLFYSSVCLFLHEYPIIYSIMSSWNVLISKRAKLSFFLFIFQNYLSYLYSFICLNLRRFIKVKKCVEFYWIEF